MANEGKRKITSSSTKDKIEIKKTKSAKRPKTKPNKKELPQPTNPTCALEIHQIVTRMNCPQGLDTSHNGYLLISLPKEFIYYFLQCPDEIVTELIVDPNDPEKQRKGRGEKKTAHCPHSFFQKGEVPFPQGRTFTFHINMYYSEDGSEPVRVLSKPLAIEACKYGAVFLPKDKLNLINSDIRDELLDAVALLPICFNCSKQSLANKNKTQLQAEVILTLFNEWGTQILIDRFILPTKKNSKDKEPQQQHLPRDLWEKKAVQNFFKTPFVCQDPVCERPCASVDGKQFTNSEQVHTTMPLKCEKTTPHPTKRTKRYSTLLQPKQLQQLTTPDCAAPEDTLTNTLFEVIPPSAFYSVPSTEVTDMSEFSDNFGNGHCFETEDQQQAANVKQLLLFDQICC